ncbi:MAG: 50S ribosomal protein L11 methyltransferase [Thermoanaerobaculia bacterium]
MKDYILEIAYPPDRPDADDLIQGELYMLGSAGSVIEERGGVTVVSAYFATPEQRRTALEHIAGLPELAYAEIDREHIDWLEHYEQSLVALPVGDRFLIAPDERLIDDVSRIPIIIPQEQAFGTGSHETTALCIEMLETLPVHGRMTIDVGTGSGILAIAMTKLGARRVVAFDNDLDTLTILPRNCIRNGVARGTILQYFGGLEALRGRRFGMATMNILPDVIVPLLPRVRELMEDAAPLILSGILTTVREEVIVAAEAAGFELVREAVRGEWWCGVVVSAGDTA